MCGIAGIYNLDNRPVNGTLLKQMTDILHHRGPDDEGHFVDENIGLGHRRLSIIDLSPAGHQPMSSDDEMVWITYNGEIYNFIELRKELIKKGGIVHYVDKSYNDYGYEDLLQEADDISLSPLRKKNSKRLIAPWTIFLRKTRRRRVETTASQINVLFPKSIHAVTSRGFELKSVLFIIAFVFQCL